MVEKLSVLGVGPHGTVGVLSVMNVDKLKYWEKYLLRVNKYKDRLE